ncbi:MAG TPA: MFS transporter [Lacunisphaera sp.]|jgi:ACS family hexuronate transporter-like MFS transporter|nr:MFS transporter [Lacunisphaera sp.]
MNEFNKLNEQVGRYRWTICALVFAATTINYLDRNVLGLLKQTLSDHGVFGPDKAGQELNYSTVVVCFQIAYAVGMLAAGRFIDWIGTKAGYAWSLIGWSIAAIGHAFGHHTWSFGFWRAALGFTEAGNFPAANKTMAEWFPKKERAYATGLYNSGANIGSIVAPLYVPYLADAWGWEWAFVLTGAIGLIWIAFWVKMYGSPAAKLKSGQLSPAEYDYIHSDQDEQAAEKADTKGARVSGVKLLAFRQTWAFVIGKFLTDPIWWFFLFWLPAFLGGENSRKITDYLAAHPDYAGDKADIPGVISWPIAVAVVYTVSTVGSIFGGWLPKKFINGGMDANKARKLAMFIFALLPLTVLLASRLGQINTWLAVATIAIATAAHQAWSANIFTTVSDMFPKKAVASVTGLGGMAGAIGGILIARVAGLILQHFTALGNVELGYGILFVVCGTAYLVAWFIMHLLVPRFKQVVLNGA